MSEVRGKHVFITGAASGMGAVHARTLTGAGANVVIADRSVGPGQALAKELGAAALFVELDVTHEDSWAKAVIEAEKSFGPITSLINNAGLGVPIPFDETSEADFRRFIDVNQIGVFLGMKAVVPSMRSIGGGSITNISSASGLRGGEAMIAYVATKFAVTGMTKAAAVDLGPDGIRVNSVHPGVIAGTGMVDNLPGAFDPIIARTPLRRLGKCSEVADLVKFLVSDDGGFCTGAEFVIDGGLICRI